MKMEMVLSLGSFQKATIITRDTSLPEQVPGGHPGTLEDVDTKTIELHVRGVGPGFSTTDAFLAIGEHAQRKLVAAFEANLAGDPTVLREFFDQQGGIGAYESFKVTM